MAEVTTPLTKDMKKQAKEALKGLFANPGFGQYSPRELRYYTERWTHHPTATFTRADMQTAGWWIPMDETTPKDESGGPTFKAASSAKVNVE